MNNPRKYSTRWITSRSAPIDAFLESSFVRTLKYPLMAWLGASFTILHYLTLIRGISIGMQGAKHSFGTFVNFFGMLSVLYVLLWNRRAFYSLIELTFKECRQSSLRVQMSTVRRLRKWVIAAIASALVNVTLSVSVVVFEDYWLQPFFAQMFSFCYRKVDTKVSVSLALLYAALISVSMFGAQIFISLAYSFVAQAVVETLEDMNGVLDEIRRERAGFEKLAHIWKRFEEITGYTETVNSVSQNAILLWFAQMLIVACQTVVNLMNSRGVRFASLLFFGVRDASFLVIVSFVAARVSHLVEHSLIKVGHLSERALVSGRTSDLQLLHARISASHLALSAGGCFSITRRLFLSYAGLVLTYTVVYFQL